MATLTLLQLTKQAMRITVTAYDDTIQMLIDAAVADLGIVDVTATNSTVDPLLRMAIITYVRLNFGTPEDYDDLKRSYDEQKAQLISNSNYGLSNYPEDSE